MSERLERSAQEHAVDGSVNRPGAKALWPGSYHTTCPVAGVQIPVLKHETKATRPPSAARCSIGPAARIPSEATRPSGAGSAARYRVVAGGRVQATETILPPYR